MRMHTRPHGGGASGRYMVDETSPSRSAVDDDSSYEILSKCLDKELLKARTAGHRHGQWRRP